MNLSSVQKIATVHNVAVRIRREQGKRVLSLHGFKSDCMSALREINGFHVEDATSGFYLFSKKSVWK